MKATAKRVFPLGVWRAMTDGVKLTMLAAAAATAALVDSWLLGGVALAAYGTAVAHDVSRLGFWSSIVAEVRRAPPPLPLLPDLAPAELRTFLVRLEATREERERVLTLVPRGRRDALCERVAGLEERAMELVRAARDLSLFLKETDPLGARADVARVRRLLSAAQPEALREQYERWVVALRAREVALEALSRSHTLALARIEALLATIEAVPALILRAHAGAAPVDLADEEGPALLADLGASPGELDGPTPWRTPSVCPP